jgi:hypothetical protein
MEKVATAQPSQHRALLARRARILAAGVLT